MERYSSMNGIECGNGLGWIPSKSSHQSLGLSLSSSQVPASKWGQRCTKGIQKQYRKLSTISQ